MKLSSGQLQIQGRRDSPQKRIGAGKDLTTSSDFCGTIVTVPLLVGDGAPAGAGCVFEVEHCCVAVFLCQWPVYYKEAGEREAGLVKYLCEINNKKHEPP